MEIIDNFLEKKDFIKIKTLFNENNFNWFLRNNMTNKDSNIFFNHCFYNFNSIQSPFFNLIEPIINKLNCAALIQIRANLVPSRETRFESGLHTDYNYENAKTAIFYMDTCNGPTVLVENNQEKEVQSVENRMLIFSQKIKHKMISATDINKRVVINFNYF